MMNTTVTFNCYGSQQAPPDIILHLSTIQLDIIHKALSNAGYKKPEIAYLPQPDNPYALLLMIQEALTRIPNTDTFFPTDEL